MLLILALLAQAPQTDPPIDAFLKNDAAARAELLKFGAFAIRPLRAARDKNPGKIDALIYEIKNSLASENCRQAIANLEFTKSIVMGDYKVETTVQAATEAFAGATFIDRIDPGLLKSRMYRLEHNTGAARVILDDLCRQTGLDYGFFHGMLVVGHPERLWPIRPPPVPPLDDAASKRARELVEKLGDDFLDVRESATRDLLAMGVAVLDVVEPHVKRAEPEIAARSYALVRRLRPVLGGVFHPPAASRQKLEAEERGLLALLQNQRLTLSTHDVSFEVLAQHLLKIQPVPFELKNLPEMRTITLRTQGQSLFDVLALLTQTLGLDFAFNKGKLIIDSREAIDQLLMGK